MSSTTRTGRRTVSAAGIALALGVSAAWAIAAPDHLPPQRVGGSPHVARPPSRLLSPSVSQSGFTKPDPGGHGILEGSGPGKIKELDDGTRSSAAFFRSPLRARSAAVTPDEIEAALREAANGPNTPNHGPRVSSRGLSARPAPAQYPQPTAVRDRSATRQPATRSSRQQIAPGRSTPGRILMTQHHPYQIAKLDRGPPLRPVSRSPHITHSQRQQGAIQR
jgi:hypothetical protein